MLNLNKELCVFVISWDNPDGIETIQLLRDRKYDGDIYVIIGNDDPQINIYKNKFNDKLIIFDKTEIAKNIDVMDNFGKMQSAVYVRNAVFDIAKTLNYNYFLLLDDDYNDFFYRYRVDNSLKRTHIKDIKAILEVMLEYMINAKLDCLCMSQGGDFIGGIGSNCFRSGLLRKAMNAFIFKASEEEITFTGTLNEDVNMYTSLCKIGKKIFTIADASLDQAVTQHRSAGLTKTYLELGTYVKSFYSVMLNPSFVKISAMGDTHNRIHHKIMTQKGYPMILSDKYKKGD